MRVTERINKLRAKGNITNVIFCGMSHQNTIKSVNTTALPT